MLNIAWSFSVIVYEVMNDPDMEIKTKTKRFWDSVSAIEKLWVLFTDTNFLLLQIFPQLLSVFCPL